MRRFRTEKEYDQFIQDGLDLKLPRRPMNDDESTPMTKLEKWVCAMLITAILGVIALIWWAGSV